jgi:uncharacterized membrane protein
MVIWEKYVKKYVWDERSTPFLVSVKNLNQAQAKKELFLFAIFLATPLALQNSDFGYAIITFFAVSIVTAAGYTNHAKNRNVAIYCGTAPLALLGYFIVNGFPPKLHLVDHAIMITMILCWLRYTFRVISITGAYSRLSPDETPS